MSIHIYKIILSAVVSLSFGSGFAKTITGKQCRQLLSPVSSILSVSQRASYYKINDEITNVAGSPLSVIAEKTGKTDLTKNYISAVKKAISQCSSSCEGLPLSNNQKFNCKSLAKDRPVTIFYGLKELLKDEAEVAIIDEDVKPEAKCAFNSSDEGCPQPTAKKTLEVVRPKLRPTVETPIAQSPVAHDCSVDMSSEGCRPEQAVQKRVKASPRVYQNRRSNGFEYSTGGSRPESTAVEI